MAEQDDDRDRSHNSTTDVDLSRGQRVLPAGRAARTGPWAIAMAAALSLFALAAPQPASAAAVIDPVDQGRAGEGLVISFTTGETGTLVVTAPEHATIGIVTTGGCDVRYAAEVRCGTDAKTWTAELMATVRIDPDAPVGTLAGGSIAFEVGGTVVAATPFTLDVLPPHVGQAQAGRTLTMGVPVNGGTSGVMRFTAPDQAVIVGHGAPDCIIGPGGSTMDCGTEGSFWDGVQTIDLAVSADAGYGTLRGGTMGFIQTGRTVSTTPYELELTPGPASVTSPVDGLLTADSPLRGTAPVGTEVEIEVDAVPVGTTEVSVDETWVFQPSEPLPEGTHTVTVRARAGGLESAPTDLVVTVVAPVAPVTPVAPEVPEVPGVPEESGLPGGRPAEAASATVVGAGSSGGASDAALARTGADGTPFALALGLLLAGAIAGVAGTRRSRAWHRD